MLSDLTKCWHAPSLFPSILSQLRPPQHLRYIHLSPVYVTNDTQPSKMHSSIEKSQQLRLSSLHHNPDLCFLDDHTLRNTRYSDYFTWAIFIWVEFYIVSLLFQTEGDNVSLAETIASDTMSVNGSEINTPTTLRKGEQRIYRVSINVWPNVSLWLVTL